MTAPALRVRPVDDVAVALHPLAAGEVALGVAVADPIPAGHKFALRELRAGDPVRKLGHPIGVASVAIASGAHVHTHNLAFAGAPSVLAPGSDLRPPAAAAPASFTGYHRVDGRVGTRNHVGVITSVNCSAAVARRIAAHFDPQRLPPGVDGVVALTHSSGCGMAHTGDGIDNLRRVIAGYAAHPCFGGVLVVGLGCEVNQLSALGLTEGPGLRMLGVQASGGTAAAIDAGEAMVADLILHAAAARRAPASAADLVIGLQCGGSDGYSGLTANPALGLAADRLVAMGATVILSETPEIYGAEHLLLARAATPAVAAALEMRLAWWRDHAARNGADLNNNPSPGNIAGGLTTILEKSLGAVAKSGSTPLHAVLRYAEPVPPRAGFVFMDTPGYDPASATGQIAGGANLIVFTTGRGAVFGSVPAPTLKLSSNSALAAAMPDDIDVDCGTILTGEAPEAVAERIVAAVLAAAGGRPTASEREGLGEDFFVPWTPGAAM